MITVDQRDLNQFSMTGRRARLLVVDDQPTNIRLIHQIFADDYDVFMATNGEQALELCASARPDIVLLDVMMPGMSGQALCRILKEQPETSTIPVIFVTAHISSDEETACWEAGGVDFVNKPVNPITLRNRVNVHLALKFQADRLREMAFVDGLTGVANRRRFEEQLDLEFRRSRRSGAPLALLMIDVDLFKVYNDRYGHQAGDECLRQVAAVLRSNLERPADLAARYGGEEFACLLPETGLSGAQAAGRRLVEAVHAIGLEHLGSNVAPVVTISVGGAVAGKLAKEPSHFVAAADAQLYRAKREGRNRVCIESFEE